MDSRRNARVVGNSARVVENATNYSAGVVRNQENASFSGESRACETCGQSLGSRSGVFGNWDGFPPGVKFDPTDEQLLHHLEAAIGKGNPHPHIGSFIPVLDGEDGICQTHPMNLPGVKQDGSSRHFFHKPAKAYTTGTRKRRKIHSEVDEPGVETRWHKTGKTRSVSENGVILGWKKIMVLYKNSGAKKSKPEKTNWILHQYHLGNTEEETDGELVVCKVFYQKQPRQCTGGRQADGVNEMENVDLNQGGSGDMSFTCRSEVSRGTAASPKVDTPQRPRSSRDRGEATGRMRGALQAQSGKGSELTVIGMETQAAVASELTSTPATYLPEAVTPARTNFASGSYINSPVMKTFDLTVAENYTGEWNGTCEEVSTSGKSCQYETDNQVGGGTGSTAMVEEGEQNQFQGVFDESQQQMGTEDVDVDFFCKEVLNEFEDSVFPGDGLNFEEFSNPHMEYAYVDLPSSFPHLVEDLQFNDSQEAWAALDPKASCPVLDNEDSLSST